MSIKQHEETIDNDTETHVLYLISSLPSLIRALPQTSVQVWVPK